MYENILIPTDGSDIIDITLEHGLAIAKNHDSIVHALYIVDNRLIMAADEDRRETVERTLTIDGKAAVEEIEDRATSMGLTVTTAIRTGTPDREIKQYASENSIDLIAIGTHGKSPREKLQSLGSVTERVVDSSPIPVLVVRNIEAID